MSIAWYLSKSRTYINIGKLSTKVTPLRAYKPLLDSNAPSKFSSSLFAKLIATDDVIT